MVEGLLRIDDLARHREPPRPVRADEPRQAADAARAGQHRQVGDLGKGEGGRVRSEAEVARHTELDADAEARALRREHDRLLDLLHLVEEVVVGPQAVLTSDVRSADDAVSALAERASKVRDVDASGEVPPLGGDDENPVAVIVGEVERRPSAARRTSHG